MVTPNDLPRSNGTHARRNGGYVTQSAGFKPAAPKVTPTRTDEVTDSDGIVTRMVTTPKAVRVTPKPMLDPVRKANGPVTTRQATPWDVARLSGPRMIARSAGITPSPFDRG
jgi:hypothetical protein